MERLLVFVSPLVLAVLGCGSELSDGVSHFVLEVLVELGAFDEAVPEAGFLVGQQLILIQADQASGMALVHRCSSQLVLELFLELVGEDVQIVRFGRIGEPQHLCHVLPLKCFL